MSRPAGVTAGDALRRMRRLPYAGLDEVAPGTMLILAPHPDDESLGCGGLIAEACAQARPPCVLFVTDGTGSHPASPSFPPERLRTTREAEALDALAILGLAPARVDFLRLPDTAAPQAGPEFEAAVARILAMVHRHACKAIAAPWQHDPHCDHLAAHRMAEVARAAAGLRHLAYPVWGWTLPAGSPCNQAVTGYRLDITRHLPAKRRAIAAHRSQLGGLITDDPHGFRLPPALLALFDAPYEVFLTSP